MIGFLLLFLSGVKAAAQPIPVGDLKEEQYRMLQLLGDSTVATTLNDRPLWDRTYRKIFKDPKIRRYQNSWWARPLGNTKKKLGGGWQLGYYEPVITNTINSELPLGGNNGSAWYGRGANTEFQGGFYLTSKYVTATFRPHITYTQNTGFTVPRFIPRDSDGNPQFTNIFNGRSIFNIDMPFRFGADSFTDFNLGLTSLSLHYKSIEAGLSNAPLWWGPGIQNALVLSNNAPGLRHAFFGTRSPLALPVGIGDLEFKFIWAKPKDSKYFQTTARTDRQRFTTGTNINYSPGFAPNLSLGFDIITHKYIPGDGLTISDFGDAIPLLSANSRQSLGRENRNLLGSIYLRWAFPESGAEIYGEYFREDNFYDARDLFLEPNHDRAYTIGFQKVVENKGGWLNIFKINGEISSLVPARVAAVRKATFYYTHSKVKQGHTNEGQVLGAAIGPGSASQFLGAKGYFKRGNMGLFIQRVAKNDYFYYSFYRFFYLRQNPNDFYGATATKDIFRNRVNLNIGLNGRYKLGNLLFGAKLIWNDNLNYGRFNYGKLENVSFGNIDHRDVLNLQFQFSVRYYFGSNLFK